MRKIWISIFWSLFLLVSCDNFLDVSSDNEVVEDEMFENYKGVRMSVNGIYNALSSTDLYGKNLTWGFSSIIGHNYDEMYMPLDLNAIAQFNWESSYVEPITESIWKKAYNIIASCNNIIRQVEKKDSTFFEYGEVEKNMVLGEMYGVRALLHFEVYRLFAPAPVKGYKGKTIPYSRDYPDHQPVHRDADEVLDLIVGDMERAKGLLAVCDTVFCVSWNKTFSGRTQLESSAVNNFFACRGTRMNFWSAAGLLARIYMYRGNETKAYENANIVYQMHLGRWFQWTDSFYQGDIADVEYIHPKRPEEILLCFYNTKNYDNWEASLGNTSYYFRMKNMADLFQDDEDDFRLVGWYDWYGNGLYLTWIRPTGTSYLADEVRNQQGPLLPVISFPEMYHIMAECLMNQGNVNGAVGLLNTLRENRGVKSWIATTIDPDSLKEILMKDIVRETLTSGQTFFLFKRWGRNIYNGMSDIVMDANKWTIPLPQSEVSYQL